MCRQSGRPQDAHRLAGCGSGGQHVVHQHHLGIRRYLPVGCATGERGHPPVQVPSPLGRCQAHRIAHPAPRPQQGYRAAARQPSRSYRRGPQHRITASAPRRHGSARCGHQHQWPAWRTQVGERGRERRPQRLRQIPPSAFLDGEHRPARGPRILTQRPARDARIGTRPYPHRRTGQRDGALGTPIDSGTPAARADGGQHQIEQGSHRHSVLRAADKLIRSCRR